MANLAETAPVRSNAGSFVNDPKVRGYIFQIALLIAVLVAGWIFVQNARVNLASQNIATGFGFLENTAGFGINQTLIPYSEASTYGRAFLVGLLNTLLVAVLGIILATIIGFLVGIARLSKNKVVALIATTYVEVLRNLPLLFQILFWYLAVLGALPGPRQSLSLFGEVFINNRGIIVPRPVFGDGTATVLITFAVALFLVIILSLWASQRQEDTGKRPPMFRIGALLLIGMPLIAMVFTNFPITFESPVLRGFNFAGGVQVIPELFALVLALSTYTGAFIAEIVRSGILAVSHGQTEAAGSLGLKSGQTLRLVVVPQAMRVIIPPLTSQYLNLTKNSSLAVAIGYPDLVAVFAGTTLNQTGQAIEVVAMTMACYLVISILTSIIMNGYNKRVALVER